MSFQVCRLIQNKGIMSIHTAQGRDRRPGFRRSHWNLPPIALAALFLYGCSGAGSGGAPGRGGRKGGSGDVPVLVAVVERKNVPVEIQVIGNVEAYATIAVKAQVGGQLTNVYFHEGDSVKKGAPLFTIDPRPFDAAVNQAVANHARDEAALGQAKANLARDSAQARYAEAQAARYAELFQSGIISKDQNEQLRSTADAQRQAVAADEAAIKSAEAAIGSSQAAIETARIQLDYTSIRSPIDGRTGALNVKQGNVVTANTVDLMTINQVQPIYATFAVPEAQLPAIKRYMAESKLPVRAQPQDNPESVETGVLTFVDNSVDMTTGSIKLKGTFPNADNRLWPGQFVHVTLRLTTQANAVVAPSQAVQNGQNGSFVYVVKADRTVESRPVITGARVDQDLVIDQGLQPGETVVTEGQLRLAQGSRVVVRNAGTDGRGGRS
jgi:multidrug efflux system membrane fusion protein